MYHHPGSGLFRRRYKGWQKDEKPVKETSFTIDPAVEANERCFTFKTTPIGSEVTETVCYKPEYKEAKEAKEVKENNVDIKTVESLLMKILGKAVVDKDSSVGWMIREIAGSKPEKTNLIDFSVEGVDKQTLLKEELESEKLTDPVMDRLVEAKIITQINDPDNQISARMAETETQTYLQEFVYVESVTEPVVETISEPVVEAISEPVVEAISEPVVEATETIVPVAELTNGEIIESVNEIDTEPQLKEISTEIPSETEKIISVTKETKSDVSPLKEKKGKGARRRKTDNQ